MDSFSNLLASRNEDREAVAAAAAAAAAASRQKSCNACVRGKRRCDKRTPRCSRCAAKGLDCVYQRMPPPPPAARSPHPQPTVAGCSSASSVVAADSSSSSACVPEFDMGFDMVSLGTDTSPENLHTDVGGVGMLGGAGGLDFSIVDLMNASGSGSEMWNLQGYGENKMDLPPLPSGPPAAPPAPLSQQQPIRDLSLLQSSDQMCLDADPLQVHDPRTRMGFVVHFLSSLHATFARTRALPFVHPRLWTAQLPKAILAAFSAATAYGARSPANKAWTIRLVSDAAREIHREGERAATSTDKLARVQALTVLNSVRVFDGDVGLRAAAEREMAVLLAWIKELEGIRDELEAETRSQRGALREPPKSWEVRCHFGRGGCCRGAFADPCSQSWIFLESARRSIMAAYAFLCLVYILKSEEPEGDMWNETQSFTASRHLWEANSSVEFYRAWREKPQYWIENLVFKDFWMYGRPADLDEFTRLMLTSQVGVDAMDHFMEGDVAIPV
ncbi:Fungal Zn(2)-Cys(6) binuclear cluster domain containing protein [Tolypocladium paradoxum]|uniref:Fungal Zn(2)-Cys(6) binuclear cluster domain containing protein n=1 Tax=Tolypocladium paradoxum TaxID=94208 RepID=A0A2S4LBA9_9HYPO|nr:Fungal Zn(2)-Cys(6) binuclear cluster domain containing protein [Tolypocladium paradoxum]